MAQNIHHLAQRLSEHVEAVCAHYLSNGRRNGRYWIVGDVSNTPGRSMWVRLQGPTSGHGAAGKWTDAATGQFGDLVDLIALNCNLSRMADIRDEILSFLSEPRHIARPKEIIPAPRNSTEAARRLFAASVPVRGTVAERYLRSRAITSDLNYPCLRFHPGCYYRGGDAPELQRLPALIAGVTTLDGDLTGLLRIYLAKDGSGKANVSEPKLAMGNILANCVRFGVVDEVLAAGEGVETVLALRTLLPTMPMVAALSAGNLGAIALPTSLKRLYIAMEANRAGRSASERLALRAQDSGIEVYYLISARDDWNSDLQVDGIAVALHHLLPQLLSADIEAYGRAGG